MQQIMNEWVLKLVRSCYGKAAAITYWKNFSRHETLHERKPFHFLTDVNSQLLSGCDSWHSCTVHTHVEPLPGSSLSHSRISKAISSRTGLYLFLETVLKIAQSLCDWHSIHRAEGGGGKERWTWHWRRMRIRVEFRVRRTKFIVSAGMRDRMEGDG